MRKISVFMSYIITILATLLAALLGAWVYQPVEILTQNLKTGIQIAESPVSDFVTGSSEVSTASTPIPAISVVIVENTPTATNPYVNMDAILQAGIVQQQPQPEVSIEVVAPGTVQMVQEVATASSTQEDDLSQWMVPLEVNPDGSVEEIRPTRPSCDISVFQFLDGIEGLFDLMMKRDGRICAFDFAPRCPIPTPQPYIDWELVKVILPRLPEDTEYYNVAVAGKDLKEVSALRGISVNVQDSDQIKIDESYIWTMLNEAIIEKSVCSDPEGRPVLTKVDKFVKVAEASVAR